MWLGVKGVKRVRKEEYRQGETRNGNEWELKGRDKDRCK